MALSAAVDSLVSPFLSHSTEEAARPPISHEPPCSSSPPPPATVLGRGDSDLQGKIQGAAANYSTLPGVCEYSQPRRKGAGGEPEAKPMCSLESIDVALQLCNAPCSWAPRGRKVGGAPRSGFLLTGLPPHSPWCSLQRGPSGAPPMEPTQFIPPEAMEDIVLFFLN